MPTFESSDGVTGSSLCLGGSGPRLLFVHATGFCATVWRPFAEALSDAFECWALDVRSHGHSTDQADGSFVWEHTGDDVLGAIDAIEAAEGAREGGWFAIGHSMGGASLLLAEEQRPGTFAALWLFEPIVFPAELRHGPDDAPTNPLAEGAKRRRAVFESADAALANFAAKPPMNTFHPEALAGYVERGFSRSPADGPDAVRLNCAPEIESLIYRGGASHPAFDRLDLVRCPTTVVGGNADMPGPASLAPLIAAALPVGTFLDRSDMGHFGPLESPEELAKDARSFFDEVAAS